MDLHLTAGVVDFDSQAVDRDARMIRETRNVPRFLVFALAILSTVTLAIAPALSQNPAPEARFAFVIGNDLYQNAPMPTASNDAGLVADTLQAAAFDVTGARNLDQDTL